MNGCPSVRQQRCRVLNERRQHISRSRAWSLTCRRCAREGTDRARLSRGVGDRDEEEGSGEGGMRLGSTGERWTSAVRTTPWTTTRVPRGGNCLCCCAEAGWGAGAGDGVLSEGKRTGEPGAAAVVCGGLTTASSSRDGPAKTDSTRLISRR
jgi:hypothetical protein